FGLYLIHGVTTIRQASQWIRARHFAQPAVRHGLLGRVATNFVTVPCQLLLERHDGPADADTRGENLRCEGPWQKIIGTGFQRLDERALAWTVPEHQNIGATADRRFAQSPTKAEAVHRAGVPLVDDELRSRSYGGVQCRLVAVGEGEV